MWPHQLNRDANALPWPSSLRLLISGTKDIQEHIWPPPSLPHSRQICLVLKSSQSLMCLCLTSCVQSNHLFATWLHHIVIADSQGWNGLGILLLNCCLVALKELTKSIRTHVIIVLQSERTADYLWDLSPVYSYLCAMEKEEPWAHLISSRCLSSLHRYGMSCHIHYLQRA
jgi:hypothetical protein